MKLLSCGWVTYARAGDPKTRKIPGHLLRNPSKMSYTCQVSDALSRGTQE